MPQSATTSSNRPIRTWKAPGGLSVAVWEHHHEDDGRTYQSYSVRFSKRIRNRETEVWEDTDFLRVEDLPGAAWALHQAFEFVLNSQSNDGTDPVVD